MTRWLWALLGGVVLVAIAAVFWTASNQTNVTPPVSPGPATVTPVPSAPAPVAKEPAPSSAAAPAAQKAAPSPPPLAAKEAAAPPAPAPPAPAPTPAPDAGQRAASPPAPAPSPMTPSAPPVVAQEPSPPPAPLRWPNHPYRLPRPDGRRRKSQHVSPKSLAQLVGAWAYSAEDCDKLFQRSGSGWAYRQPVDKFAQAAIVESPKRILLPSATCRIDGASNVEGALKVTAECADSISYTSRSTVIMLRSATELVYSASGDAVLATTLKKCTP